MKNKYPQLTYIQLISLLVAILAFPISLSGQYRSKAYEDYILTYNTLSIQHMHKYKIPASITLAQGILESGAGKSMLSKDANNHFGIKCHKDWNGDGVYKDDDYKNECFRKYKHASESYEDHSRFLTDRPRYSSLFFLASTDYRGWAKGLQQAGYATDKTYANKLIKIIEDYALYQYDTYQQIIETPITEKPNKKPNVKPQTKPNTKPVEKGHVVLKTHDLVYVVAKDGDTHEEIAKEFDIKVKDLYKFNEVPKGFPLKKGDLVYFEKKRRKAQKPYDKHTIRVGESMHSIAQLYGIQVKYLYKMNKQTYEYVPVEDDILKLR